MCTNSHAEACCAVRIDVWWGMAVRERLAKDPGGVKRNPLFHAGLCTFYPASRGDASIRCESSCMVKTV